MNDRVSPTDLKTLPVAERLRLMDEIWESLSDSPALVEVPVWHREELDRRLANRQADASTARPWEDVRNAILQGLRKP